MTADAVNELLKLGYLARRGNRPNDARVAFGRAVEAARSSGERRLLALALAGLGQIERDLGDTAAAVGHYVESTAILRDAGEPQRFAHTIRHLGDILRERGELAKSASSYEEALAIYRQDPGTPPLDLANALRGYALLKAKLGDAHASIQLWREAGAIYESLGLDAGVTESRKQIAELNSRSGAGD